MTVSLSERESENVTNERGLTHADAPNSPYWYNTNSPYYKCTWS